jgi:hypothetical protein
LVRGHRSPEEVGLASGWIWKREDWLEVIGVRLVRGHRGQEEGGLGWEDEGFVRGDRREE